MLLLPPEPSEHYLQILELRASANHGLGELRASYTDVIKLLGAVPLHPKGMKLLATLSVEFCDFSTAKDVLSKIVDTQDTFVEKAHLRIKSGEECEIKIKQLIADKSYKEALAESKSFQTSFVHSIRPKMFELKCLFLLEKPTKALALSLRIDPGAPEVCDEQDTFHYIKVKSR